ncbi:monovalent cation/H+ antiporter subunit D [Nitrosomonas sp. ANs5]|uniref:monovalent cation/H+ antiporter subunit D n=1 Tax=Nitrosomonas sp. ANs5 TaxID=3423941 RepID=UPI003D328677
MTTHLVITSVLLPLLTGVGLLLLRQQPPLLQRGVSIGSVFIQVILACQLLALVNQGDILTYALGNWPVPFGIVLVADRLAIWMLLITALIALFSLLYALLDVDKAGRHFHVLFQLQLFGLNGAFLTGDLFNLFVFFEILLIASYSLLLHGGGRLRTKAGLHFVVINLVGSTLFLFAVGMLYGILGTLNMADLALKVTAMPAEHVPLIKVAGLMLFGVFALKAALIPLYLWLPNAYAQTSAPVAALFAIMTKVGAYSILRVYTLIFGAQAGLAANLIEPWLLPLALLTLVIGMLGVIASTGLRQQAAYLVIASVGTLLTAIGLNTQAGIVAGLYYLPHSTFAAAACFLLANTIAVRRGEFIDRFESGPPIPHARLIGGLFFVTAVLLAGLPPLSGFIGKFMILKAALAHLQLVWIMGIVLTTSLLALIALARSGSLLFYKVQTVQGQAGSAIPAPITREVLPIAGLLALCVVLVAWAGPVTGFLQLTAEQLLEPSFYIQAVMTLEKTP